MQSGSASPNSINSLSITKNSGASSGLKYSRGESMAYPKQNGVETLITKVQYHARKNTKAVIGLIACLFFVLILTSETINESQAGISLRGGIVARSAIEQSTHWGGAVQAGYFYPQDALVTKGTKSSTNIYRFAAVTDLDQLSAVKDADEPTFRSLFIPGLLKRTGTKKYEITFETPRELVTHHNEAGRGAEFSELTIYNDRLLTFDDRTGDVFEILNNMDGTDSSVVPRFVVTEGEGETDKGMKWEWATVKDNDLYMGSMGKEYTRPDGSVKNVNNLWIGILNARGELRRENWTDKYAIVRKALGALSPGYIIMEAILWSPRLKKWVFLPRRISSTAYDSAADEKMGGNKLVLVDEKFTKAEVVEIKMVSDSLRGFSSFAFVPETGDRHALAIRSVEDNCAGDLDVCKQRSYFLVFDITTGEVLSEEMLYEKEMKLEGVEFANMYALPPSKEL